MKRDDNLYELGVIIQHNFPRVIKGRGSAIFFHIWDKAGCAHGRMHGHGA